jgi:hypothetical protein
MRRYARAVSVSPKSKETMVGPALLTVCLLEYIMRLVERAKPCPVGLIQGLVLLPKVAGDQAVFDGMDIAPDTIARSAFLVDGNQECAGCARS